MTRIRLFASLLILGCAAAGAMLFTMTHVAKTLELTSLESRLVFRGERQADSSIVLVMWDSTSAASPQLQNQRFRSTIATMIRGLAKMQARAIAIDFFFEEPKEEVSDSLLRSALTQTPNAVSGYWLRRINEPEKTVFDSNVKTVGVEEYPDFLFAQDKINVFPGLANSPAKLGFVNVLNDLITAKVRTLSLYIRGERNLAAFAVEIVKLCLGITDEQTKIIDGKLVLLPAGREPIRIPMNKFGECEINYLGAKTAFAQRYSLAEVYALCQKTLADSSGAAPAQIFKDKIVFIGSEIDPDIFMTPFTDILPGVFIHATVVDNILREQFITRIPQPAQWGIFLLIAGALFWLFSYCKLEIQGLGVAGLLIGYALFAFVIFDRGQVVMPLISALSFILIAATLEGVYLHLAALKRQKLIRTRIRKIAQALAQLWIRKQFNAMIPSPHYSFAIDSQEAREEHTFIYWLRFIESHAPGIPPFEPEIKFSMPVHRNVLNKLEHDIQKLWQRYFNAIENPAKRTGNLAEELKRIGNRLVTDFGLKQAFHELFENNHEAFPLKLAVTNMRIPWQWAFAEPQKGLLCEKYPMGFTFFDSEKENYLRSDRGNEPAELKQRHDKTASRIALLYYGDWEGHPQKQLTHVRGQIIKLQEQLTLQDCSTLVVREKCQDFLSRLTKTCAEGSNLRLVHYAGHAEKGFLDVGEHDILPPKTISEKLSLSFTSRPLVFLNACSSGQLSEKWEKMNTLCTEFLACGAGACIVTNFDVYEKTAGRFAEIFYEHFVSRNLPAGEALRLTIASLGKPDKKLDYDPNFDLTRYFYTLYGDPTIKF